MKPSDVLQLLGDDLIPASERDRQRLDGIDKWLSTDNPVEVSRRVHAAPNPEKEALAQLSYTPILRLLAESVAQQMVLESVHSPGRDTTELWAPWERNGMPTKQGALWFASAGYGGAYTVTLPGMDPDGSPNDVARITAYSPRDLYVVYGDVVEDEWPMYGLRTIRQGKTRAYRFIDDEGVNFLSRDEDGKLEFIEMRPTGLAVPPIVCYANGADLEGRSPGEVEKHEIGAKRLNKTTWDRMNIQHHNSWRILTATGLEEPGSTDEKERTKALLRNEDVLTGGDGVTFSTLPETTLDSILKAASEDRDSIAAMSQTPVWALNGGQLVNLSADALVEARRSHMLKIRDKQRNMGRPAAQNLRLAAVIEGRDDDAEDFNLRMRWADLDSWSLSQAADALGKIATQLGVPPTLLWDMIPGLTEQQVQEWRAYAEEHPTQTERLAAAVERLGDPAV